MDKKLSEVMTIIEKAAVIMEEKNDFESDKEVRKELAELQKRIRDLEKEATFDYWYDFLELETGIDGVMDYLFCENEKGEIVYAPIDTVMEQIEKNKP